MSVRGEPRPPDPNAYGIIAAVSALAMMLYSMRRGDGWLYTLFIGLMFAIGFGILYARAHRSYKNALTSWSLLKRAQPTQPPRTAIVDGFPVYIDGHGNQTPLTQTGNEHIPWVSNTPTQLHGAGWLRIYGYEAPARQRDGYAVVRAIVSHKDVGFYYHPQKQTPPALAD